MGCAIGMVLTLVLSLADPGGFANGEPRLVVSSGGRLNGEEDICAMKALPCYPEDVWVSIWGDTGLFLSYCLQKFPNFSPVLCARRIVMLSVLAPFLPTSSRQSAIQA